MRNPKTLKGGLCICLLLLMLGTSYFCSSNVDKGREQKDSSVTVFLDVNVVPMDSERILERQTLIVREGLIERLGPVSEIQVPEGAKIIEGHGRYIMPGLADMHFHNENENDFGLCLANGVTTIRNMWGDTKHLEWRRRIESGEILGPTIITSGPLLDGPPPVWEGSTVVETVEQARQAVIEQKGAGYDFIKIYDQLSLEVFNAIMEEAKRQDIPVAGHIPPAVGVKRALRSGLVSNEHLTGYMDMIQADDFPGKGQDDPVSRLRGWIYLEEEKIPSILALTKDSLLWDCVTLVVYQGLASPAEYHEFLKRPEMEYVDPLTTVFWDPSNDPRWEGFTPQDFEQRKRMDSILKKLTGELYHQNGRILLGTDCQNKMVIPGFSIHQELQNLVEAGLTPFEAIKAGTKDAALFLQDETFGTISVGKRADLVLVAENPLADVSHIQLIEGVMVRGEWLPPEKLNQMLDDIVASFTPPEDRFEAAPPLTSEEAPILSARFEARFADLPIGEERFIIEKMPNGLERIQAQAVTDSPYGSFAVMTMQVDESGRCHSLKYHHETSTGEKKIDMRMSGNNLRISGNLIPEETLDSEENVSEDFFLGAPMLSNLVPLVKKNSSLKVGEKKKIKGKAVRVIPFWFITFILDETITISRAPDNVLNTARGTIPVKVFQIEVSSEPFPHTWTIFLDKQEIMAEGHLSIQYGLVKFIRLK